MLKKRFAVAWLLLVTLVIIGVTVLTFVVVDHQRNMGSFNHLSRIALALVLSCHFWSVPPVFVADKNGRPMHSWRVLILPFLGYEALYRKYDFREPWDSPKNRTLSAEMPIEYQSGFARDCPAPTTPYLAVVGKATAWPGEKATKRSDFTNPRYTVLVVEAANSDIDWMEPRDMPFDQAMLGVHSDDTPGIRSYRHDNLLVANASGDLVWLPVGAPPRLLKAAFTISGEQAVEFPIDAWPIFRLKPDAKANPDHNE